jgi:hypothetical protein
MEEDQRAADDCHDQQRHKINLGVLSWLKHTEPGMKKFPRDVVVTVTASLMLRNNSFLKALSTQRRTLPGGFFIPSAFRPHYRFLFAA